MKLPFRFERAAGVLCLVFLLAGCISLNRTLRCAPVAIVNGQHILLKRSDYLSVEMKLAAHLEDRGMKLISDHASADMLVTIAFEPDPTAPGKVTVLVLDIVPNQLNASMRRSESRIDRDYSASRPAEQSFPGGVGTSGNSYGGR